MASILGASSCLSDPGDRKNDELFSTSRREHLPVFTIMLEGLITKFMRETAAKLKLVFDAMRQTCGGYLFDEFDALRANRNLVNDVGEIRRVLNSFLRMLEKDASDSLIVAATNQGQICSTKRCLGVSTK